jgi:nascent polypeptide-associated complex subunit alpha
MSEENPSVQVNEAPAPAPAEAPKKSQPKKENPKKEQPKKQQNAESPKAKQPKPAQPKATQPKAQAAKDQPKSKQPKSAPPKAQSTKDQPKAAQPKGANDQPKPAAPKAQTPKAVQPKGAQPKKGAQKAKKEEPVKAQETSKKTETLKKDEDEDKVKVEEIPEGKTESDEEGPPPLEDAQGAEAETKSGKLNRNEKKARKAIGKLGLKPVPGINRVTVKKAQDILFIIAKPDIYKTPGSDTYVIFGEAKIENLSNNQLASKVKEVIENREGAGAEKKEEQVEAHAPAPTEVQAPKIEEIHEDEPVDETGLNPQDIELLMGQSSVSRARAVRALKATNGDIVNAIMQLTTTE